MSTILELLPQPSALDAPLIPVLENFQSLIPTSFSSTELQQVLAEGGNLPIPDSLALVSEPLSNLQQIAAKLPSKPGEITATLQQELNNLLKNGGALGDLLKPIARFLEVIAPLLEKFDFFSNFVVRINDKVNGFSEQVKNRSLADISAQFQYLLEIFNLFPELNNVSPFKDLKAQVEKLPQLLSGTDIVVEINALGVDLPKNLNNLMQWRLDEVSQIEVPLAALNYSRWLEPYNQALEGVEKIDLNDLSQIKTYLTVLETQVSRVEVIGTDLTNQTQSALENLESFDGSKFFENWSDRLKTDLISISPKTPGALSETLGQMQKLVGGLEIGAVQSEIARIGQQLNQVPRKVDFSSVPEKMEAIANQIASSVDTVDQGLVKVATFLSNLVKELGDLIGSVNLPELLKKVQDEFELLRTKVEGLLSQVQVIPDKINDLVTDLGTKVKQIDFEALKDKIAEFFKQITSVLNDPQIQYIRTSVQQGIEAITENLSNVSLKPVFERVLTEIADVKTKLATVNVSQLNDLLKKALKLALDELRKIDFAQDVADKLKEEFHKILKDSTGLIKLLQGKYQEIVAQIKQFAPGTLIADKLAPSFEKLVAELEEFEPSKLLNSLKKLYDSLLNKLKILSPKALLSPLSTCYSKLMDSLRSLSPQDLITPLNNLLSQFTSLLDRLKIEEFIFQANSNFSKIKTLIGNVSPGQALQNSDFWQKFKQLQSQGKNLLENGEKQIDQCLEDLIKLVPDETLDTLTSLLDQLQQMRAIIDNQMTHPSVQRLQEIAASLKEQSFAKGVTELTKRWLAEKQRFNEITPPPELVEDYNQLKAKLQLLSPIQVLGEATTKVERFTTRLSAVQTELTRGQQDLSNLLTPYQDKLLAILPQQATTAVDFLRYSFAWQIGRPGKKLLGTLKQKLAQLDQLFIAIEAIALKFTVPLEALTAIPGNIGESLLEIKKKITALNFDFLQDELQTVIDAVINQLDSLNPDTLLDALEKVYQNLINTIKGLYPTAAVEKLDDIYKNIVLEKLKALHPQETIAKPLDNEYQKIRELQEQLNLDKIFDALIGKLDTIEQELDDGLKQTATAFNQLLQALPL
ncbi:MAG: hypothetical protein EWV58_22010 [Microcystis aeruginosa Ma_MB_F_20061100_S19]|uniref:Phage-related protein n=1 Tax=Microcystis aeruginosa SPC777 TaxID=482300 RepID=S3JMK9_MICAE|nr:hypothetical protein [Microcystis aeruginosa]NCR99658.1 hypothetical protein [Microcystis aeruginosa L311-01]OCY13492.1 MAG: hypothetical protein BEV12_23420 [Microcystis aeruginosa CACIAM 03]TRU09503.1 MAG: hypothetical protein EWV58_22010 [Microcystis aeruginosa Ma_MB_F_20061100_S19]TRU16112.1 MAG: hypothetical protein EWV59_02575 [Microcystis aeruginosa Ma_MB_F_20061100_S19D]EPF21347.1 Phage-related protein [Microcystis aeruginosa SPC777]